MEALRVGWGLLSTEQGRKEEDALNLALALSLSEQEQRKKEERQEEEHVYDALYNPPVLPLSALLGDQYPAVVSEMSTSTTPTAAVEPEPKPELEPEPEPEQGLPPPLTPCGQRREVVARLPKRLRESLEHALVEEGRPSEDQDTPVIDIDPQDADRLSSPRVLSVGASFDERMQRIASAFDLSSLRSAFSPRVNTDEDQPASEKERALRRLHRRLAKFTLVEYTISGDGNCQFASLSDQLYRTPKMQSVVRQLVVQQLEHYPEYYARFVPGDYQSYRRKMGLNHTWGDHITLQAAADRYGIQISLITSYKDAPYLHIMPREIKSCRILWLSFQGELHYNSLYTQEDIELRRKMDDENASCVLF